MIVLAWLKIAGEWLWGFLKAIPWPVYAFVLIILAFWVYGEARHHAGVIEGETNTQALWDASNEKQARADKDLAGKQAQVTETTRIEYIDRVQTIRLKGDTIIKEVVKYVPLDTPALPGGFRLLHDAAAAGEIPDPAGAADAAPVPAATVAETVAANYTGCLANAAAIESWQAWATAQAKLTE